MLRDFLRDLQFGARALRRSPGFTLLVVLSVALGIAGNAAIFSLVNAVLLRPLPVSDPDRLLLLTDPGMGGRSDGAPPGRLDLSSHALYQRLRAGNHTLADLAGQDSSADTARVRLAGAADDAGDDRAVFRAVTANYFSVLGVPAARGRTFLPSDEAADTEPVVVLSHGYWQRRFGGNPALVGARLTIDARPYSVLGVTAPGFTGFEVGGATDFWIPVSVRMRNEPSLARRGERWLHVIGRLKPSVSASGAQAELDAIYRRFLDEEPPLDREKEARARAHLVAEPGAGGASPLRQTFRGPLLALMAGVAVLLLIVCLNVSHLVMARALGRRREMSIRAALGASGGRLARQLFAESLILTGLALAAAALAIPWLKETMLALAPRGSAIDASFDLRVVSFTALLTIAVTLVLGTVPAWSAARANLEQTLRGSSHAVTTGGRRLVSRVLLVSQVAFSLVLLVGAALLTGTLQKLRNQDKGFDDEHVLLAGLELAPGFDRRGAGDLHAQILARVRSLPGVRAASLSRLGGILGGGRITEVISVPGKVTPPTDPPLVQLIEVSPEYFDTVGMSLVRGRGISRADGTSMSRVAVVNETLARQYFDGVDRAPGHRFSFDPVFSPTMKQEHIEVVGVVRDARINDLRRPPPPVAYLSVVQPDKILGNLQVRTAGDPRASIESLRRAIPEVRPGLSLASVRTVRSQVERTLAPERLLVALSTRFGVAALFLVCLGLYGVISQWAGQRRREIGVRMALGATAPGVRWLVLRQAFVLLALGLAAGIPAALAASHLLEGMLFGLRPTDPVVLAGASLVLLAAVTLAAYLPARRASRVDPMSALRAE